MDKVIFLNGGTRGWLATIMIWLAATSLPAQTTGTLIGTTRLQDGTPVAGVLVRAESANLQGARTAVSSDQGVFRFALLPAGDYTLTTQAPDFKAGQAQILVGLSQVFQVNLMLEPKPSEETLEVVAQSSATVSTVDVTANYSNDFIDKLPQARGLTGAALLAPGTTDLSVNRRFSVSGAPSFDNLYLINGSIANFDNVTGAATDLLVEDALQELTVLSGSVSAEFGYFSGGVVNAVTKSGGNQFEGTLRFQFTNDTWRARTPIQKAADQSQESELSELGSAVLGGPIMKDRLWFFAAIRRENDNSNVEFVPGLPIDPAARESLGLEPGFDPPGLASADGEVRDTRFEFKLTAALNDRQSLTASYMSRDNKIANRFVGTARPLDASGLLDGLFIDESLLSLQYHVAVSDRFSFEALFSDRQTTITNEYNRLPVNSDSERAAATPIRDTRTFATYNAPFLVGLEPDQRDNRSYRLKATYLWLPDISGIHNLSLGYQHFADSRLNNNLPSASGWVFFGAADWDAQGRATPIFSANFPPSLSRGPTQLQHFLLETPAFGTDFEIQSLYLNDEWVLNDHWQFNLGVRYDRNAARAADGTTVSDDDAVSPRFAMRYMWQQAGVTHQIDASYAAYVARLSDLANSGANAGQFSTITWNYTGPTTTSIDEVFAWIDATLGPDFLSPDALDLASSISRPSVESQNIIIADDLKSPHSREWRMGYAFSRDARRFFKIDYIHRTYEDYYATFTNLDVGRSPNGQSDVRLIGNDPGFYSRDYDSVQIQFAQPLASNLTAGGAYTWSQLIGNLTNETATTAIAAEALTTYPEYVVDAFEPVSALDGDQRHNLKIWLSYDYRFGLGTFNASLLQQFQSGLPYGATGNVFLSNPAYGFPENPGYARLPMVRSYNFEPNGTYRTEDLAQTDLALNFDVTLGKITAFARIDIFNLFNQDALYYPSQIDRSVRTLTPFNVFTDTPVEGENWVKSNEFGKALSSEAYQRPREFRIDLGVRF